MVLSLAFAGLWWLRKPGLLRLVAVLLALSALSILTYTGGEMMVVRARPLWATAFLPINLALTGMLGTLGAVLLVARWLPASLGAAPLALVRRVAQWVSLALVVTAVAWALLGAMGQSPSFSEAISLFNDFGAWKLALLGSVAGGLVLLALIWRPLPGGMGAGYALLLALAMLVAAWVFRWIVFMAVQTVPKFGAGLYLQGVSWGSDGVLGMVGVFGLVAALIAIVTWGLFRFPPRSSAALA